MDHLAGISSICEDNDLLSFYQTSYRVRDVRSTLRKVWKLRQIMGVTRVADITELDRLGIPVATVCRPKVHETQITAAQGKGIRGIDAIVSALLEAVERHSASVYQKTIVATIPELNSSNRQYVSPSILGIESFGNKKIEWVSATSLRTGQANLVPASEVLFPYNPGNDTFRPTRPSTTGLASGNTIAEAILHALFEVIERDTVSKYLEGGQGKLLDLNSLKKNSDEQRLVKTFIDAGIDLFILDLSELSPTATFRVFTFDHYSIGPQIIIGGQGSHIHPAVALRRALAETAQSRVVSIQASREDLIRHAEDWNSDYDEVIRNLELIRELAKRNGMSSLKQVSFDRLLTIKDTLCFLCEKINTIGFSDILYTDLTDPQLGIPTVHVVVPGMIDIIVDPNRRRNV